MPLTFALRAARQLVLLILLVGGLAGCERLKFPRVFKIDIAQGNIIEAAQVAQLKMGMTQNQVIYLLGSPMIQDPFHQDRWDYYYYLSKAGNHPTTYHVILYFTDARLARYEGAAPARLEPEFSKKSATSDPLKDLAPL